VLIAQVALVADAEKAEVILSVINTKGFQIIILI
jgi:hypothetical protein